MHTLNLCKQTVTAALQALRLKVIAVFIMLIAAASAILATVNAQQVTTINIGTLGGADVKQY